ncbi:MAG: 3D-(3,5/4)-trihydroxycyclohexane-1,2-dione acylhydrolase (decyclizing) [Acidobacteriota bacterium]|nr:3D-(3,5/4)-trihydroxycyclohexane-1,2-dione acylhydrolase (decyclizing) [Acidobacteriota bacterium]
MTAAQALLRFLAAQVVERDGVRRRFFGGCFGIFGHGNVAGIGQALHERPDLLRFVPARNEQGMVHAAVGYARQLNRLGAWVCTSSIGPGATNMVTGAALATVNRLPVLLLPGDVFASRLPDPVLQQLESGARGDVSANDCFIPVSRYFDRIERPEQVVPAALAAMRVLTSPAETGAVTLAFPQDVQVEAFDVPEEFLAERVWRVPRQLPDAAALAAAAEAIRAARRPLIVAGGGTIYSEASEALRRLCEQTGIPVGETQAGKGSLPYDHPSCLGAVGATGTLAANRVAADVDLVIGVGTRYGDFTTASKTAFRAEGVRFVNVNVAEHDAAKHAGIALVGDARATLERLAELLAGHAVDDGYRAECARLAADWDREVARLYALDRDPPAQSAVIGAVNDAAGPADVVVCAAGSMPGDLHKLWRTRDPKGYHVEYGYSCMGYEIAGGLGAKLAAPGREVFVLVGDGSYLMLPGELVTAVQEGVKLTIVLVDNRGYASIGALSRSLGTEGLGTGQPVEVDLAATAESLGARAVRAETVEQLRAALRQAKEDAGTTVIVVRTDREAEGVPAYESWWDGPVAEVSETASVRSAREAYELARTAERRFL